MATLAHEKNKDNHVGYVYEAAVDANILSEALAVVTLFALFFLTLTYFIVVPLALYYMWVYESLWILGLLVVLMSSPFWASGTWHAIGDSFVLHTWRLYFQFRVYKERPIQQDSRVLFTFFPHGLFPLAIPIMSGVCKRIFPELLNPIPKVAIAENMFSVPIISPLLTWLGCIPAREDDIKQAIEAESCALLPDGIAGVFHSSPDEEIIYVRKRRGFIRIAIETGATLVPCYCFGHTQLFTTYPQRQSWLAEWSRRIRFSIVFFAGHSFLPPLPRRVPLFVVIGSPFQVNQCEAPSEDLIEETLQEYISQTVNLFNNHKHRVPGYKDKTLYVY